MEVHVFVWAKQSTKRSPPSWQQSSVNEQLPPMPTQPHVPLETLQPWLQQSESKLHGDPSGTQPQTPPTQTPLGAIQTLPQLPQFWLSLLGSMQPKSPQTLPAQSKQVPPPQ